MGRMNSTTVYMHDELWRLTQPLQPKQRLEQFLTARSMLLPDIA